jgi:hypothetical protein
MSTNAASVAALIVLLSASMQSYAGCSPALTTQFESTQRIVDSVRPDKPGQTRVFASDGSVFTGADALWMKGQLRLVQKECAQSDEAAANKSLHGVIDFLGAHRRAP